MKTMIIRIFGFCIASTLTIAWVIVWWWACLSNQSHTGPWRVVLDFGTLPVWLEAIPEGIFLHVLSLAFLALAILEAKTLASYLNKNATQRKGNDPHVAVLDEPQDTEDPRGRT